MPNTSTPDAPTRSPHVLDVPALQAWLGPRLPGAGAPLQARRLHGGQSNPTWLLQAGASAWVLRAKPGPAAGLLPSAHAIEREFQVIRALQGSAVPVPAARLLCEDESVIGAAFYVMDFVEGRIFRDATLPDVPVAERAALHDEANRVLAALHQVDWRARGLADFGRQGGYFERLIQRWTRQYRATQTGPCAAMERLIDWLPAHIPAGADDPEHTRLTHGDYRIENMVFHPSEPRVLAVLDWELATLGHPLGDLAYHAMAWHLPAGVLQGLGGRDLPALGLPDEAAYLRRYCERTGRDPEAVQAHWPFYLAFNCFRLSAILQGIAHRIAAGTAASPVATETARMAGPVAELGWRIATRGPAAVASPAPLAL